MRFQVETPLQEDKLRGITLPTSTAHLKKMACQKILKRLCRTTLSIPLRLGLPARVRLEIIVAPPLCWWNDEDVLVFRDLQVRTHGVQHHRIVATLNGHRGNHPLRHRISRRGEELLRPPRVVLAHDQTCFLGHHPAHRQELRVGMTLHVLDPISVGPHFVRVVLPQVLDLRVLLLLRRHCSHGLQVKSLLRHREVFHFRPINDRHHLVPLVRVVGHGHRGPRGAGRTRTRRTVQTTPGAICGSACISLWSLELDDEDDDDC